MGSFLQGLGVACGRISPTLCRLALEAQGGSFGFTKCQQVSREVGAALGWGFSLVSLEKQESGHRLPLRSLVQVEAGRVGVSRLPWVPVGAELLPRARKELPPGTSSSALTIAGAWAPPLIRSLFRGCCLGRVAILRVFQRIQKKSVRPKLSS